MKAATRAPGVRIIDGKRIDLVELRKRRKLARERAKPVEDTRVADTWARTEAKERSAKLDRAEKAAIKKLPPKAVPYTDRVDNPDFSRDHKEEYAANFMKVKATLNANESAISVLAVRKLLHPAQVQAADRFRRLWEKAGGAGAGAMDYTREPVDGGGARDAVSLSSLSAVLELDKCRELLGVRGYRLVASVAGEGRSIEEVAGPRQRDKYSLTDALRGFLEDLAVMWGYSKYAQPDRVAVRK